MTNHHVVEDLLAGTKDPKAVVLRFDYEVGTDGAQFYTENHLNVPLMLVGREGNNARNSLASPLSGPSRGALFSRRSR